MWDKLFGVPLKEVSGNLLTYKVRTKLPAAEFTIIGVDWGAADIAAATYNCGRCGRPHFFSERPETIPHAFVCECGNRITVDDPILRALPLDILKVCDRRVRENPAALVIYEHEVQSLATALAGMTRDGWPTSAEIEIDIRSGLARYRGLPVKLEGRRS
ncbi:hypothetical protein ACQR1I_36030 [Bradyrhizobium sp. HKCCYLS2038]|uniref:hypothetical protein n=1 Tax=Bradyrhizobium sp. HKCCYLS2038 TaxID=3420764 RepID=UPI003EBC4883